MKLLYLSHCLQKLLGTFGSSADPMMSATFLGFIGLIFIPHNTNVLQKDGLLNPIQGIAEEAPHRT